MAAPRLDEIKEFEELMMGRKRKMGMKNFGKSESTSYLPKHFRLASSTDVQYRLCLALRVNVGCRQYAPSFP